MLTTLDNQIAELEQKLKELKTIRSLRNNRVSIGDEVINPWNTKGIVIAVDTDVVYVMWPNLETKKSEISKWQSQTVKKTGYHADIEEIIGHMYAVIRKDK